MITLRPGRLKSDLTIGDIRIIKREDLALLEVKRPHRAVKVLRDPHHKLARAVASGMTHVQAAMACGYSSGGVNNLMKDPSFIQLVAEYRSIVTEAWKQETDHYMGLLTSNQMKAERQIAEHLDSADEEGGELLPVNRLIEIARDAADRTGYGKRQTNLNVNVDFAAQLEKAIRRSGKGIQIEGVPVAPTSPTPEPGPPRTFVRRIA